MKDLIPALLIDNLCYSYKTNWLFKKKNIIKNLYLNIQPGDAFGFLGQNGAGKTTTIKCILNLNKFSSGKINIFGINNFNPKSRLELGYLPEQPYWYDYLTVKETLEFYAYLYGIDHKNISSQIEATLKKVNIWDRKDYKLRSLSKGLTQRVGLATAIVHNPKILILDEPFSGLDPISRKEFREIIKSLHSEGVTIFMSSHALDDVSQICNTIGIISAGEMKSIFNTSDNNFSKNQIKNYELIYEINGQNITEIIEPSINPSERVKELVVSGAKINQLNPNNKTLEEIFVETVS